MSRGSGLPPVLAAKTARTFCYGFLGVLLPIYLIELGMTATGVGAAVTATLAGSALLTWLVRRPAERFGARPALWALTALTAVAAVILLATRNPWAVVLAAVIGNVAVGTGETGPFLTIEQVVVARAVPAARRTAVLSVYNLLGYAAAAIGAASVAVWESYRVLFLLFLAGAAVQAIAYTWIPARTTAPPASGAPLPSAPLIRRLAALFALDSFAGGFVLQSLVAYYLHMRFDLSLETLGIVFAGTQVLTGISMLLAARAAARFGLLPTMVVSHLVSNALLIAIAFAPTAAVAVGFLLARHLLSQMDVPTRQAYVMAVVADHEREAAASLTNLTRTVAQAITPTLTGWVMQAVALSAPFVLGGTLKIAYDIALWRTFKDVKLRD
ncbi:MAG: MFS transporter [Candidatus Rokubacteria bacterium]|nr:MFS transporter [Candidatus Rokubacteria bacterium]